MAGRKPISPEVKRKKAAIFFDKVKELMELGFPKYEACKRAGIDRNWLHRNLTNEQKRILDEVYFSFSQGSTYTKWTVEGGNRK